MVEDCEAVEFTTASFVTAAEYRSAAARARAPRVRTWLVYLLGSLLVSGLAGSMATMLANGDPHIPANTGHRVFGTYWASGDAANHGANPYAPQPLTFRVKLASQHLEILDLNLSPPVTLPLFQTLARLPIATAARVWTYASYLLFIVAGAILLGLHPSMQKRQALWLLLSGPVIGTLMLGQIYSLLLLLAVLMWASLRREHILLAALCLGTIIAIRPLFLAWPVLLLLRGERRLAWQSVAIAAALTLLPLPIYGADIYMEWFRAIGHDPHSIFLTDIALPGLAQRLGYPRLGWALAAVIGAACAFAAARRRAPIHLLSVLGACLCAPLAWFHYLMAAYPWLVERRWNWRRGTAAALLLVPDASYLFMQTASSHWWTALGNSIAMAIPLLLFWDVWLEKVTACG